MTKGNASDGDRTNRTRRSTGHRVKARAVSLSPDDAVGRDVVGELRAFLNNAKRDDRLTVSLPNNIYWLLEQLGINAGRKTQDAFAYCLKYGLPPLLTLDGIAEIRGCRKAAVVEGSEDLILFETFLFEVAARSGSRRRSFRKIDPEDVDCCRDVARELGLPMANLVTLATMTILLENPDVPDNQKHDLFDELIRFGRAVKRRARLAQRLRNWAGAAPAPSLHLSLDDVRRHVKEK